MVLREILDAIRDGPVTVAGIVEKTGISRGMVEEGIRMLVQMGKIREMTACPPDVREEMAHAGKCAFCPLRDRCPPAGGGEKTVAKYYVLSDSQNMRGGGKVENEKEER